MQNDSRYPYTYACDYLRELAGYGEGGTKLSRADAKKMLQGIAGALGMADNNLARKLADCYQANQEDLTTKSCEEFALAGECQRYRAVLERIATPKRPDGTYNLSRGACELLARDALGETE